MNHSLPRAPAESLGDHSELFMLFNNRGSWASEEQYKFSFDLLSDRLIRLGTRRGCYLKSMKKDVQNIRRQLKKLGIRIKVHHIYTALAGALGYSTYQLARDCRTVDDYIDNLWPPGITLGRKFFLGKMPKESPNKPSVMRESPQHLIRAAHEPDELFRL